MAGFDVVVLGGGSGGYACALAAAGAGKRVALVERDLVGGTCLHRGCVPTKSLLQAAHVARTVRDAGEYGVTARFDGIDAGTVASRTRSVVDRMYRGLTGLVRSSGVTVVHGGGRLIRTGTALQVVVGDETLDATGVVLAMGARPRTLGLSIDHTRVLTSDDAVRLEELPGSAIVLGGGVIGVELATAWAGLGVRVTVVEAAGRVVPTESEHASRAVHRGLAEAGVAIHTGSPLADLAVAGDGVVATLESGTQLAADVILVAVGRAPATSDAWLAEAGVDLSDGWVSVDEYLRTSVPGVYAVGDLVRGPQLAHRGFAHGLAVARSIANGPGVPGSAPQPDSTVPRVIYTTPEVLSVGLSAEEAAAGGPIETIRYDLAGNARAQILRTRGFVEVVRRTGGPVLGIQAVGEHVSELAGEAEVIVGWQARPDEVAEFVHAHPTVGEALGEAMLALAGTPLHGHH